MRVDQLVGPFFYTCPGQGKHRLWLYTGSTPAPSGRSCDILAYARAKRIASTTAPRQGHLGGDASACVEFRRVVSDGLVSITIHLQQQRPEAESGRWPMATSPTIQSPPYTTNTKYRGSQRQQQSISYHHKGIFHALAASIPFQEIVCTFFPSFLVALGEGGPGRAVCHQRTARPDNRQGRARPGPARLGLDGRPGGWYSWRP